MRTPRNYDGINPPGKSLKSLAPLALNSIRTAYEGPSQAIVEAWPEIVGPQIATMTKAISFEKGVLLIKVKNSSLLSLLHQREKLPLLQKLRQRFPQIKIYDLHFRIG